MSTWVALLRGVNLGKRQVKSADLKAAYETMGFDNVRTLLASGNVIFESDKTPDAREIEAAFQKHFGFESGTILRSQDYLEKLVKSDPFGGRTEDENTKLYVTFVDDGHADDLPMPCEMEGDFKVVKLSRSEVFIVTYRKPDGRFSSNLELIWKHYGKKRLWTSRNWNTIVKAAS